MAIKRASASTVKLTPDPADEPEGSATEQHPALAGDPQIEVAQRTTVSTQIGHDDPVVEPSDYYRHEFVMTGRFDRDHSTIHVDNGRATVEAALQRGLHPKQDADLVDLQVQEPDPASRVTTVITRATYQVEVVPAVIDDAESNALTTVTPSDGNESLAETPGRP